jgi:hypothetical protein
MSVPRAFTLVAIFSMAVAMGHAADKTVTYDINTLKGKVASVHGTAGLQIRMSAFLEAEADFDPNEIDGPTVTAPNDGTTVLAPNVTVNLDTGAAPQNETSIAVDPNNPNRIVGSANDYVTGTWSCFLGSTPCSAIADGYSGTYYSNDGGATWCCNSSSPSDLGTLIPGVEHLTGGQYDAGGDPAVAFDSQGHVYYAGLGFNRASAPNTVTVSRGTFDGSGALHWGAPTFINQTSSPSTLNDKEWIAVDSHASSQFRDRVYVSWTRFLFNPLNGHYVQSPIMFAYSSDGGHTFSSPQIVAGNVLYSQGSHPVVGPDGSVYVFWDGSTRLATLDSIWVAKSTDGGVTFSKPVEVSKILDQVPLYNTAFRVNSYPAAAVAPNGDVYATWTSQMSDSATSYSTAGFCPVRTSAPGCHTEAFWSKSTDGGATWSTPQPNFPAYSGVNRTPVDYETITAADNLTPSVHRVDEVFPAITTSPAGSVYIGAYVADTIEPFQTSGGPLINNAKLNYVVRNLISGTTKIETTKSINTRYRFSGGFIGDYTDIAAGSDDRFHAMWTDTNNVQNITWNFGSFFNPPLVRSNQDVVTQSDQF